MIVTRAEWGAKPPTKPRLPTTLPWPRLWLHHTAGARGGAAVMREVQRQHQARGWRDIAYNFGIGDQDVFEGMGLYRHLNEDAGGSGTIVLLGNFETSPLPADMVERTAWLVAHGWLSGWWQHPRLDGGHRDLEPTACPGRHAYTQIPTINARAAEILADLGDPQSEEDDDMKLYLVKVKGTDPVFVTNLVERWPIVAQAQIDNLVFLGAVVKPETGPPWWEWERPNVEAIPLAPSAIDVDALATAIAGKLPPATGGLTQPQTVDAVKQALREGTSAVKG